MFESPEALLRYHELVVLESEGRATSRLKVEKERCGLELCLPTIDRHQYLFRRYGAHAVMPLTRGHCSGCHVQVARSRQNSVEKGVYVCEQCGRMVFDTEKVNFLAYGWTATSPAKHGSPR